MAVTTQESTEYDAVYTTEPATMQDPATWKGRVRCAYFTHNQSGAGDATSSVALAKLPAGKVRLLASQSKAYVNWTTASAKLDIGWDAYTTANVAQTAVAADPDGIDNGINVESAGFQTFGSALTATGGTKLFNSLDGVVIRATSQDTAIANDDDLVGYLLYVVD